MERNITKESLNAKFILVCVLGLGLSVYAYIVETKLETNDNYEPMCDLHEKVSCSKAFSSEYGKGFGLLPSTSLLNIPNSLFGITYYCLVIGLTLYNNKWISNIIFVLVILSNMSSVYFAYILYFILADFCIICVSLYVINAVLLRYAWINFKLFNNDKKKLM